MINDLLYEKKGEFKRYLFDMTLYVLFDVGCLVLINTLMTHYFSDRNFRHLALFILLLTLMIRFCVMSKKKAVRLIEGIVSDIRERIIETVRRTELEAFEKVGKSEVYNAITLDTRAISDIIDMLASSIEITLLVICIVAYLGVIHIASFLFVAGIFIVGISLYYYQILGFKILIHQSREKEKELFDATGDLLDGFKELRINKQKSDDFFHHSFEKKTAMNRVYKIKAEKQLIKSNVLSGFFEFVVFVPILFILPAFKEIHHSVIMITVTMILFIPFFSLKETVPYVIRSWVAVERIFALGKQLEEMVVQSGVSTEKEKMGEFDEIKYSALEFNYTDGEGRSLFSVSGINLSVYPGEIIFVTGGNGSGKSTLIKMLTGLYIPHSGRVDIDGSKIDNIASIRSLFSAVFSDFHLLDRLYGVTDVNHEKVKEWLEIMELENKVQFENGRFTTLDLSTGEKKRLSLVTAVMEEKPICILDEWAAEQSPRFRKKFYESLLPKFKEMGKTVIAVTHDDLYFHTADRVLKLDYGRLVEA